jgi:hypothetical protein
MAYNYEVNTNRQNPKSKLVQKPSW